MLYRIMFFSGMSITSPFEKWIYTKVHDIEQPYWSRAQICTQGDYARVRG